MRSHSRQALDRKAPSARWLAALIAALLVALGASSAAAGLFGSREIKAGSLKPFPKWTEMLVRAQEEREAEAGCEPGILTRCPWQDWKAFLAGLEGLTEMEQLQRVNREVNRRRYILDPPNWGVPDYWATPLQFFRKNGDCEDYAIVKYISLRQLGFPESALRVLVLNDLNLGVPHAILVVDWQGKQLLLDNQIPEVVEAAKVRHYQPIYSINESAWWLHRRS